MNRPWPVIAGVDGAKGGWLAIRKEGSTFAAVPAPSFSSLLAQLDQDALIAVDVPIGLSVRGPRECDLVCRRALGPKRGCSVFPAPIRQILEARNYAEACSIRYDVEGKKVSKQAFAIIPKISEVDLQLRQSPSLTTRVFEVHPEASFALWNRGVPMTHSKKRALGRAEREGLIDAEWPGVRQSAWMAIHSGFAMRDDLNDAFAALWTAERINYGKAASYPPVAMIDSLGLRMAIWV